MRCLIARTGRRCIECSLSRHLAKKDPPDTRNSCLRNQYCTDQRGMLNNSMMQIQKHNNQLNMRDKSIDRFQEDRHFCNQSKVGICPLGTMSKRSIVLLYYIFL